jgi:hypothetical protein
VLVEVVLDRNVEFTARSRVLAEICGRKAGRDMAAEEILGMMKV